MLRNLVIALTLAFSAGPTALAQDWATKMFETAKHDFGVVARGAKAEYEFVLTNPYVEDVHVAAVRVSCGCTTPRIGKETLKTYEKGAIVASINSERGAGKSRSGDRRRAQGRGPLHRRGPMDDHSGQERQSPLVGQGRRDDAGRKRSLL